MNIRLKKMKGSLPKKAGSLVGRKKKKKKKEKGKRKKKKEMKCNDFFIL